jgi:hypothetical protein
MHWFVIGNWPTIMHEFLIEIEIKSNRQNLGFANLLARVFTSYAISLEELLMRLLAMFASC